MGDGSELGPGELTDGWWECGGPGEVKNGQWGPGEVTDRWWECQYDCLHSYCSMYRENPYIS